MVCVGIEVRSQDILTHRNPSTPQASLRPEQLKSASAQAEVFDEVVDLLRLIKTAKRRLLCNDDVGVDVSVDEVRVYGSPDRSFDPHQAVLDSTMQKLALTRESWLFLVRFDPCYILAPPKSPALHDLRTSLNVVV
jgi:hypothetical protein